MKLVRASAPRRGDLLPTADDLAFARATLARFPVSPVPMLRVERTWFALECLQPAGSFKIRGALVALARAKERGVPRVVAASAGNHGIGVAIASQALGVEATIVVPRTAPRKKLEAIRARGADVLEEGEGYDAAEAFAMALAKERGLPFVSPYDDVDVVAGNGGTLALEIEDTLARHGAKASAVLAPFGGGGLATGLACGFGPSRIVWGVQSEASPAFALSLERGAAVTTLPFAETLADGIEGGIAEAAFARAAGVCAGVVVVSEREIAAAMKAAFAMGLVVEGSAAAALAPTLGAMPAEIDTSGEVVVVLTGRNVDRGRLSGVVW